MKKVNKTLLVLSSALTYNLLKIEEAYAGSRTLAQMQVKYGIPAETPVDDLTPEHQEFLDMITPMYGIPPEDIKKKENIVLTLILIPTALVIFISLLLINKSKRKK